MRAESQRVNKTSASRAALVAAGQILTAMVAAPVQPANANGCSLDMLNGRFIYYGTGLGVFPPPAAAPTAPLPITSYSPVALTGVIEFDGAGGVKGEDVVNLGFGGVPRTYTGSYAVNDTAYCSFYVSFTTAASDVLPALPSTLHVVLGHRGNSFAFVNTVPGLAYSVVAQRQ